ncbi:hypothetical protein [Mycobacteroides chelonae]|uniref:hypothetical protein n=1 Tax=Mycobacteroides chelonae TaxID=1774 RepID=UPI0009D4CEE1|nr:Uncharacterised protein [Mycobacteroides abscessus subsp. bolletii]
MRNDFRRNIFRAMTSGALILAGCSQPGSGTPTAEHPTAYSCQAQAVTGEIYTRASTPKEPFTVSIPKLPGWEPAATARTDNKLAVVKTIGISKSLTMLMSLDPASSNEQAAEQLDGLTEIVGPVKITHDETIEICGIRATRLIATTGERAQQYDYLNMVYHVGDDYYPVQLRNQMSIGDVPLFSADIDVMFQGFQIGS